MKLLLSLLALAALHSATAWPVMWGGSMMRWGGREMPMGGCRMRREGNSVILSGLKFRGGEMLAAQLPQHPETWEEMEEMMGEMMGGSGGEGEEGVRAMRLRCERMMGGEGGEEDGEGAGEQRLRLEVPHGCRAGRVAVWCHDCMMRGRKVSKMLSSEALGAPAVGKAADGSALVLLLQGAVLDE